MELLFVAEKDVLACQIIPEPAAMITYSGGVSSGVILEYTEDAWSSGPPKGSVVTHRTFLTFLTP